MTIYQGNKFTLVINDTKKNLPTFQRLASAVTISTRLNRLYSYSSTESAEGNRPDRPLITMSGLGVIISYE